MDLEQLIAIAASALSTVDRAPDPGQKSANVQSRIVMTPDNAKKLLFALQDNIAKYEKHNGTIKLNGTPAPGSTIPMSFGGGQA